MKYFGAVYSVLAFSFDHIYSQISNSEIHIIEYVKSMENSVACCAVIILWVEYLVLIRGIAIPFQLHKNSGTI